MSMDDKIAEALRAAVEQENQPTTLASKLIAWLEGVISGNEDLNDKEQAERHLDVLFDGTVVYEDEPEEGGQGWPR